MVYPVLYFEAAPAGHSLQLVALAAEYDPAGQAVAAAGRRMIPRCRPLRQEEAALEASPGRVAGQRQTEALQDIQVLEFVKNGK